MFNFEIHGDFLAVAQSFKGQLDEEVIRNALATTLNAGQTKMKKLLTEHAKTVYNFSEQLFLKDNLYRIKRARGDSTAPESKGFVSSKQISMRTFVVAANPISIYIKKRTNLVHAFLVGNEKAEGSVAGVFMRDMKTPKRAMTKGKYANRRIKVGPRKGQLILRQAIDKKYTLSTADVADAGYEKAVSAVDLVKAFELRLDKILAKNEKKAAAAAKASAMGIAKNENL